MKSKLYKLCIVIMTLVYVSYGDNGGESCSDLGLFTDPQYFYFPVYKNLKLGLDISSVITANKIVIEYSKDLLAMLGEQKANDENENMVDDLIFTLMDAMRPGVAREKCRSEGKSLPALSQQDFQAEGGINKLMTDNGLEQIPATVRFVGDKVYLVEDNGDKEILKFFRSRESGEADVHHTTEKGTTIEEMGIKADGTINDKLLVNPKSRKEEIKFICQHYESKLRTEKITANVLYNKQVLLEKLLQQHIEDLQKCNNLSEADYLIGTNVDILMISKVEPHNDILVLIELLENVLEVREADEIPLRQMNNIMDQIEKINMGVKTDRNIVLPIHMSDDIRKRLGIHHFSDVIGSFTYCPKTKSLQSNDGIVEGSFKFKVKSFDNMVIVQEYRPFWYNGILLKPGFLVTEGNLRYFTSTKPHFKNCNQDMICMGKNLLRPTIKEFKCGYQLTTPKYEGENQCEVHPFPPEIIAYRTNCNPPDNTIISKRAGELMVERICKSRIPENWYFYKERESFKDSCKLRYDNYDILEEIKGVNLPNNYLNFEKRGEEKLTIDDSSENENWTSWINITVYGIIAILFGAGSSVVTYYGMRTTKKEAKNMVGKKEDDEDNDSVTSVQEQLENMVDKKLNAVENRVDKKLKKAFQDNDAKASGSNETNNKEPDELTPLKADDNQSANLKNKVTKAKK